MNFNKLLLIPFVAVAIGGGVGIAAATNGSAGTPADPPVADVKGPCEELQHATDPSCSDALVVPEDMHGATTDGQANEPGDDNGQDSNDPAEVEDQGDDDQGQQNDDQGENEQEDNSGPSVNSGSGSTHDSGDDSGQSGHDGGDD